MLLRLRREYLDQEKGQGVECRAFLRQLTGMLNGLIMTGGEVLWPTGGLCATPLAVVDGRVAQPGAGREIDLAGFWVLPGIIDLHGDGFERHLAPRRGVIGELDEGLAAVDAELACNGITTAVLAQFFSWEGGMRGPDFAQKLVEALSRTQRQWHSRMQVQLRLEINLIDEYARAEALILSDQIGYVVFNDHLPHDALNAGKRPQRLTGQALKAGRSPEAHLKLLQDLSARRSEIQAPLRAMAERLRAAGVRLGSHDDRSAETRTRFREMGVDIAEFPETSIATAAAHDAGDLVILGAPNVVRGKSHKKNQSARDALAAGHCDVLVSDYHYPSLRQAALTLVADGAMPLPDAWNLISTNPAMAMGWHDRGHLSVGAQADLVVLDAVTKRVAGTFVAGHASHLSGELAERFLT